MLDSPSESGPQDPLLLLQQLSSESTSEPVSQKPHPYPRGGSGPGFVNRVDGSFRIGSDVSAPVLVVKTEPEYSEEARKARYSGEVLLSIVVDARSSARHPCCSPSRPCLD